MWWEDGDADVFTGEPVGGKRSGDGGGDGGWGTGGGGVFAGGGGGGSGGGGSGRGGGFQGTRDASWHSGGGRQRNVTSGGRRGALATAVEAVTGIAAGHGSRGR